MNTDQKSWRRLTPEIIADLPQAGAVFELANLVRNVHYIGSAGGDLRARLTALTQEQIKQTALPGGYYLRYQPAASEDEELAQRLASYRARHGGRLPQGNQQSGTAPRLRSVRAA